MAAERFEEVAVGETFRFMHDPFGYPYTKVDDTTARRLTLTAEKSPPWPVQAEPWHKVIRDQKQHHEEEV